MFKNKRKIISEKEGRSEYGGSDEMTSTSLIPKHQRMSDVLPIKVPGRYATSLEVSRPGILPLQRTRMMVR